MSERVTGRIDWLKATEAQRAQLYQVAKAVMDVTNMDVAAFYKTTIGRVVHPTTTSGNFSRGKIARRHAAMIHAWIDEHHPDIGLKIAPGLFQRPARSAWQTFLADRAEFGALSLLRLSSLGIVQRASRFPIEERPFALGERFAFSLRSDHSGCVFAFQETRGLWHLFPLGEDPQSFMRPCHAGEQVLPSHEDGSPIPLIEAEADGLHAFVFIICAPDAAIDLTSYAGLALRPEQLDDLSAALLSDEGKLHAVHRLNVRFVR